MKQIKIRHFQREIYAKIKEAPFVITTRDKPMYIVLPYRGNQHLVEEQPAPKKPRYFPDIFGKK